MSTAAITKALAGDARQLRDGPLYLRIHQGRTKGTFYLVTSRGGKPSWRRLGGWPQLDAAELRRQLPVLLAKAAGDSRAVAAPAAFVTVGDLLTWFAERTRTDRALSESRRGGLLVAVTKHLQPPLGDLLLEQLDRATLNRLLLWPLQQRYALSTVRQIFAGLKAACRLASRLDMLAADPMAGIKFTDLITRPITAKPGRLPRHACPSLLVTLAEYQQPMPVVLALLMLMHGTRIGETIRATWADIDFAGRRWHLPAGNTKTRREHVLPLTDTAIALLKAWQRWQRGQWAAHGSRLFPGGRVGREVLPLSDSKASEMMRGLSGGLWSAHDLRKLARTNWMELGIDYMVGEMLINHALRGLDKVYIQTHADAQQRAALELWHQELERIGYRLPASLAIRQALDGERAA